MNPTANKRKGAQFELDLLEYFRQRAAYSAERLRLAGKHDEGDIGLRSPAGFHLVEAKAARSFDLAGWVTEMQAERINYARARRYDFDRVHGLVVVKRPRAKIWESYVVKTLADELLLWESL